MLISNKLDFILGAQCPKIGELVHMIRTCYLNKSNFVLISNKLDFILGAQCPKIGELVHMDLLKFTEPLLAY